MRGCFPCDKLRVAQDDRFNISGALAQGRNDKSSRTRSLGRRAVEGAMMGVFRPMRWRGRAGCLRSCKLVEIGAAQFLRSNHRKGAGERLREHRGPAGAREAQAGTEGFGNPERFDNQFGNQEM